MPNKVLLYWVLNFAGVIYMSVLVVLIAGLNIFYTCPALNGDRGCFWQITFGLFILTEIIVNLFLFQYYKTRNQISYWTVKSSSLLSDGEAEQIARYNEIVEEREQLIPDSVRSSTGVSYDGSSSEAPSRMSRANGRASSSQMAGGRLTIQEDGIYRREVWVPDHDQTKGPTKFCHECRKITPRRCHHCPLCQMCILRKDHHCMLTGGCVGLANQRYFIVFLLWACIGAGYGTQFTFHYLNRFVAPWYPFGWTYYIAPVALGRWLLSHDTFFNVVLAVIFSGGVAGCIAAGAYFTAQMFYTLNGYTQHDYHAGRLRDALESDGEDYGERLALVFGRRWWLNFLIPQIWIPNQLTPQIARNIFLSVSKDL